MNLELVAIQLDIGAEVLASADAYRAHIEAAVDNALADSARADARLVVLPELAGHLALYALAGPAAHRARTLSAALAAAAVRKPLEVMRGIATARRLDGRHAVLAALAPDGERWWKSVFAPLAKRHAAYVIAGSHLRLGSDGQLTNASLAFAPDGRLVATTDKVNLVPGVEDAAKGGLALARGDSAAIPVIAIGHTNVATLIGYDASLTPYQDHERFVAVGPLVAERGVAIVANPAGTQVDQAPRDGLPETLAATGMRWGVTAHLVGDVLDLRFEGCSQILDHSRVLARVGDAHAGGHVTAAITC